jgi:HEAT repeats/Putative zinc-finger
MTCEAAQKAIPLYIYGELPAEIEENVEAHMADCRLCQSELERHREFAAAVNNHELEPTLDLLVECRQALAVQMRNEVDLPRPSLWSRIFGFPINNFRIPAGAMALLAVGYFAGRAPQMASFGTSGFGGAKQAGMISTVRSIQPNPTGGVLISVDDTQRRVISGGLSDENIRRLLLAGMREQSNPGVRVESVSVLKGLAGTDEVRFALLDALQHDPNAGVRLKALEGLQQFAYDGGVRRALTTVLMSDANPGVRIQAIDLLTSRHDESIVGVLQNLVRKDENDYVRLRCERALQEMHASVGTF